ncbi:MAG TPA: spore germination protein GerW family protein [Actinomycetes bacterium]|jgi:uncharacterized spore protein YtfJ|nr:spore germination protein GerW family protein [Actinomycetes bacterium]
MATVPDLLARLTDNATVRRVYGEPYERDGVTIIPAAEVRAGGGLGLGQASREAGGGEGSGGGVGLTARPVGAYVIRDGRVSWQPAFDLSRVAVRGQLLAVAGLLTLRWLVKTFRRPRRRASRR